MLISNKIRRTKFFKSFLMVGLIAGFGPYPLNASPAASTENLSDDRIRIVSPQEGRPFAPDDEVDLDIEIPGSLHAADGKVAAAGLGLLAASHFTGTHFKAILHLPHHFAGPLELVPLAVSGTGTFLKGFKTTINVRPRSSPVKWRFPNRNYYLSPGSKERISLYPIGIYNDGTELDLSSSVTGTAYATSDPAVVTVDKNGTCKVIGTGVAVITVKNGIQDSVMFTIEDEHHPNPAVDVTDKMSIIRGPLEAVPYPGFGNSQRLTITNTSQWPLTAPLFLVVTDLPSGVKINGNTIRLRLPDGLNLYPGQTANAKLRLLLPKPYQGIKIPYTAKIYHAAWEGSLPQTGSKTCFGYCSR